MVDIHVDRLPTANHGMHVAHLNLQSIRNKIDVIKTHIKLLDFDVFTFSESWLDHRLDDSLIHVQGYDIIRHDRTWSIDDNNFPKKGGGVGMYIKSCYNYSLAKFANHNYSTEYLEIIWIEIIMPNSRNIVIGSLYRPPAGNITRFCDKLTECINEIADTGNKHIVLLGDFNINYLIKGTDNMKALSQFELFTNLKQLIHEPTRFANLIDLIYSNSSDMANSGVMNLGISDHDLIFCTIKKARVRYNIVEYSGRSYANYNKEVLHNSLMAHEWDLYYNIIDPNLCWDYFMDIISATLDDMCPIKKRKVRDKNEPWLTNEIMDLIFEKNRAWRKAKKTKNPVDLDIAKTLRNRTKQVIRQAKSSFVQDYLDNDLISTKKFWEKINYIMPSKDRQSTIKLIDKDSNESIPNDELPSYINSFFTNIGPVLAQEFDKPWRDDLSIQSETMMPDLTVDEYALGRIIEDIDVYKSSSIQNISSTVLKDAFQILLPALD